jgi:hypothetical protein
MRRFQLQLATHAWVLGVRLGSISASRAASRAQLQLQAVPRVTRKTNPYLQCHESCRRYQTRARKFQKNQASYNHKDKSQATHLTWPHATVRARGAVREQLWPEGYKHETPEICLDVLMPYCSLDYQ